MKKYYQALLYLLLLLLAPFCAIPAGAQDISGKDDYRMAINYYSGENGYQRDLSKAVEYFKKAEQKGCYDGDLFYGHCLAYGNGVTKNVDEGAKRIARAASTGDAQALYFYAVCIESGVGVKRNAATAKAYFAEAAKKGNQSAISALRDSYGVTNYSSYSIDWHNSERFLANNTLLSDGKADYRMAMNYYSGTNGYRKDYAKAVEYFKKAEQKGCYDGDLFYGFCLVNGKGTFKDIDEGARRFARAASTGDAQSLYYYGACFEEGKGVNINIVTAKAYFSEAAKKGDQNAIKKLRDSYGVTDYSSYSIDWHNSERFLVDNGGNSQNISTTIDWLNYTPAVTNYSFNLRAGVKSPSKITGWRVLVNGTATRGINAVGNDGYSLMINKNISLAPGVNHVVIEVTNASGTTVSTKDITYNVAANQSRIALVIGNSAYADPSNSLPNPANDANDVAAKLTTLGFKVLKFTDQGQAGIEKAIADFGQMARGYDVALFYYAGHGIGSRGANYIVPVDAVLPSEDAVRYKCVDVNIVLDVMETAGCPMKILVLDACRNNPFTRSWYRSIGTHGLSNMSAPIGTFISFATAPGAVAVDGLANERNSPYTAAFLEALDKPGLSITDFFQDVLETVVTKTNNRQNPWMSSSFLGKFIFNNNL